MPLLGLGAVALLLLFVYGLGDRCWWIIPFCLSVDGNLNFLPLNFSLQELAILTVFCYLLLRMIFGLEVAWRPGPAILWVPLCGVLAVVLYHWIGSGDIGIRLLGGSGWGGRKYFKIFIACMCIPLLASFPGMRWQDLQKVPLIYFLGAFVDIIPDILTTYVPAAAPLVWKVYSGVNLTEYGQTLQGNFAGEEAVTRMGTLGKLGLAVGLVTVCYFPAYSWLQPNRLWALPVVLIGGLLCALSGFRNNVLRYAIAVATGMYAAIRFRALLVLPLGVAAALTIAFTQGRVFDYPLALQRGLSFLPGDWNPRAKGEAEGSSKWRARIREVFYKEYFLQAPVWGQGYHFDPGLAKKQTDIYLAVARARQDSGDPYADVRDFIEMRMPHEGPVHILLCTGVVGAFFFVSYCLMLLLFAVVSLARTPPREVAPIQIWSAALILQLVIGFFTVFGDLTNFLIGVCPPAILLYRTLRLKQHQVGPALEGHEERSPADWQTPPAWTPGGRATG